MAILEGWAWGMVPIFDINRFAKSAGKWLHRRQVLEL
jgi:hypothetical protein